MNITEFHPFKSAEAKKLFTSAYNEIAESEWPINSKSEFIDTPFGKTFVRISGPESAPPLVLMHGMNGSSLDWSPNIKALSESYRTYAIDTINDYGLSIYTQKINRPDQLSNWLDELFTGLGLIENINLMGSSFGGWLTCQYALRIQNRLNKIILLDPAAAVLPLKIQFYIRAILMIALPGLFRKSFYYWLLADVAEFDRVNFNKMIDYSILFSKWFKKTSTAILKVLKTKDWQNIKVPVLFLIGQNTQLNSADKVIQRLDKIAPFVNKEIIHSAGHGLSMVQADFVNRKILEFLK